MAKAPRKDAPMEDMETPTVVINEAPAEDAPPISASVKAELEAGRKALETNAANRRAEVGEE